jgi:hypothetical protein
VEGSVNGGGEKEVVSNVEMERVWPMMMGKRVFRIYRDICINSGLVVFNGTHTHTQRRGGKRGRWWKLVDTWPHTHTHTHTHTHKHFAFLFSYIHKTSLAKLKPYLIGYFVYKLLIINDILRMCIPYRY